MKNVFRFGNEFWVEGDWIAAAKVYAHSNLDTGVVTFEVSFGSHGSRSASEQKPYGHAIIAACDYAALCEQLYANTPYNIITSQWDEELSKFYKTTYKEWNPK